MEILLSFVAGWLLGMAMSSGAQDVGSNERTKRTDHRSNGRLRNNEPPKDRLSIVRRANYRAKASPFGSREERTVFYSLISLQNEKEFRVFPQVPMGAYIGTARGDDNIEHKAIASLRPDFLITSKKHRPLGVVEYNGAGHNPENDEAKRIALKKAGMFYHVVTRADRNYLDAHFKKELLPKIKG